MGDLALSYELLDLPGDPGLTLVTYAAEPGNVVAGAAPRAGSVGSDSAKLSTAEA